MFAGLVQTAQRAYAAQGMLFQAHLDLLYQCDLDCEHCFLDDKKTRILPTAFWVDVLDQLADLRVFTVVLSGGELFLRKDALELIAHARRRGFLVQVKTHAGRLAPADVDALVALGVSLVVVSYYSADPAIHDAITRRPGSHAATLSALTRLAQAGVNTVAVVPVMQRNKACYPSVVAQLQPLGVAVQVDATLRPANSGDRFPQALAVDHAAMVDLHAFNHTRAGGCAASAQLGDWGDERLCVAGHAILYVDPEGKVTPCVSWPMPIADLAAGDRLADVWAHSPDLARIRAFRKRDRAGCGDCGVRGDCDYCAGEAWLAGGDPLGGSDSLCRTTAAVAEARARTLGLPAPPTPARLQRADRPAFRILSPREAAQLP